MSSPWGTIAYAVNQLSAGDILYVREGTYRETITIDKVGSFGNEITIEAYQSEIVTIDGTVDVTGTWSTYGAVSGAYQLAYTTDITQLFVDDLQMVNARWPNAQFNDDSIFSHDNWAQGDENTNSSGTPNDLSIAGSLVIDETVSNPSPLDLNNSIGILNIGSFKTESVKITSHTQNASSNDVITYTHDTSSADDDDYQSTYKDKHHYYFFEGKVNFLDVNNEWFNDTVNNILYLFPDDGLDPSSRSIKGKTTDHAITFSGASYINFKKINFFATTLKLENSDYITIEECNFYYPSTSSRMLGLTSGLGMPNVTSLDNSSDNNTIKKCLFENTEGEALRIKGDNNTVENNYFHHIDWSASNTAGLMVTIYTTGNSNTFTKNTIHTTGASATILPGRYSEVSYNKVSNTGLLQSDGAVFQGTKNYVEDSDVHHNWIFDTTKYALRFDAPGGSAGEAGHYGQMHHNYIYNAKGMMVKGNHHYISHNTVFNTVSGNGIIILDEDGSNTGTDVQNNLVDKMSAHRSGTLAAYPLPSIFTDNSNDSDDGSASNNRNGYTYSSDNISSLINTATGMPLSTSSALLNMGIVIDTDSIPHTTVGSAPDIGAYEYGGTAWTAGVDWAPKFHTTIWKKSAASTDWNTASNWSTGAVPTTDVNVIIPTGATNYPVISSSGAVARNITVNSSAAFTINETGSVTISGNFSNSGTVTLNSDADEFSSIIISGTVSGNIVYNRFVNQAGSGEWDLIGSPLDAQSISSFASTNTSGTATLATSGSYYALGTYDSSDDTWTNYTISNVSSAGNFDIGKGYQAGSVSGGSGLLKFTGTAAAADQLQAVQSYADFGGKRWNLIANPYPSYINANSNANFTNNFLTVNTLLIGSGIYLAIYGWESDVNGDNVGSYKAINHTTAATYIAPGQGFFIAAASSSSANISFTREMRTTTGGDDFIANRTMNPNSVEFLLKLYKGKTLIDNTRFYFDTSLTLGMDSGYDAGAFDQNSSIMSRLVEQDEGIGLEINAMDLEALSAVSIPLEVNQISNVPFRISLEDSTIPVDVEVQLEDRLLKTLTLLNGEDFTITAEEDLSGIGRFYLHLGNVTLGEDTFIKDFVSIYKGINDDYITIEGLSNSSKNNVKIYNLLGQLVANKLLNPNQIKQTVTTKGFPSGVYAVELQIGHSIVTKKIIVRY